MARGVTVVDADAVLSAGFASVSNSARVTWPDTVPIPDVVKTASRESVAPPATEPRSAARVRVLSSQTHRGSLAPESKVNAAVPVRAKVWFAVTPVAGFAPRLPSERAKVICCPVSTGAGEAM